MKPVINLDELEMVDLPEDGRFQESYGVISNRIGAKKLGYNLTVLPPGKCSCPYHNHQVNEEMFLILEGTGTLRFGGEEYHLRPMDVIACPPGGRQVAHQIKNTGNVPLKFLALSTKERADICEYPDSDKVGVYVGDYGAMDMRLMFKAGHAVEYMEGER